MIDSLPRTDELVIDEIDLRLVHLDLVTPLHAAHGVQERRPTVIVSVRLDSGVVGWGECPALERPTYTSEYAAGSFALLRDFICPDRLAGREVIAVGHPMARAALEDAALDAGLRSEGRSLASALGATRTEVAVRAIVSGSTLDELVHVVARRVDEGFQRIGVKITPERLVEPLRALRSTWPALSISVDANGSLDPDDEVTLAFLDEMAVDEVEQPCGARDWVGLRAIARRLQADVVLDESIVSIDDLVTANWMAAGRVINVKPARLGGAQCGAVAVARAVDLGFEVFVGGMLESGVGRAAALAVAGLEGCGRPTHLGPSSRYFHPDVVDGIDLDSHGRLRVPDGVGIGVTPDLERLDAYTVERAVL